MDILLSHGYFLSEDPHELKIMKPYPPLGLLYISSYLKSKGFQTQIFDSTFNTLRAYQEYIQTMRPPVVGLYSNLMTRQHILQMIKVSKEAGSLVILGGPDPANYAMEYLAYGADIIVTGEGELTLEELLPRLPGQNISKLQDIKGIAFLENDSLVQTLPRPAITDLDSLPYPDRDGIDINQYIQTWKDNHGMGSISLITARGCPYTCTWCSHAVFGYSHRRRSVENVADELELMIGKYHPDMVWYADDVFTINHRWLFEYASALKKRHIHIPFETISREDRLNKQVIQTLAEMGCYRLWIGSESGSQRVLDAMQRKTDAARAREMTHLLQDHGIEAGLFIMLGYDGEEIEDIEESVQFLKEANPKTFLTTVAYPIKGTPYYEAVADRIIPLKTWDSGSDRDFTIAGRHSRRFYHFATQWMVNEVAFEKQKKAARKNYLHIGKTKFNSWAGRLGMRFTQHEIENGQ